MRLDWTARACCNGPWPSPVSPPPGYSATATNPTWTSQWAGLRQRSSAGLTTGGDSHSDDVEARAMHLPASPLQSVLPTHSRLPTRLVPHRRTGDAIAYLCHLSPRPVQLRQIRAKSGEHVAQLAGQGTELEAFRDALIDPGCARGVNTRRYAIAHAGIADLGDGLHQPRILTLQRHAESQAHRSGEIVRTNEAGVDPRHAQDGVRVFDTLDVLDLEHHQDLIVRVAEILLSSGIERHREAATADTARPVREVAGGGDGLLGLFPGVDHRHDYAPGAGIEHSLEILGAIPRDAHHRGGAAGGHSREHLGQGSDIDRVVLGIDHQPVETEAADILRGFGRGEGEPGADRRLPCRETPPDMVCTHRCSPSSIA